MENKLILPFQGLPLYWKSVRLKMAQELLSGSGIALMMMCCPIRFDDEVLFPAKGAPAQGEHPSDIDKRSNC